MTERQVKAIFGVLAALVVVYVGFQWLGGGGDGGDGLGLAAAVEGAPRAVRIVGSGGDTIRLERRRDTLWVNDFPADSALAADFLAALDTTRAPDLVARNAENHAALGITADGADRVVVGPSDSPSFTFLAGDRGRGGRFVRRPDADRVYLVEGPVATGLARGASDWRDRRIAALDTARVGRIALVRDGDSTALVRAESGWRAAAGDSADGARVRSLLGELSDLTASGEAPADSLVREADFASPDALLRAWAAADAGGAPLLTLRLVRAGDAGSYLLRRGDRPYTYALAGYQYDRLFPAEGDLLP